MRTSRLCPVDARVDSSAVPLPCWTPARPAWAVQVVAASSLTLDLALDEGVGIDGTVNAAQYSEGGMQVRVRYAARGTLTTTTVLRDGTFQVRSVPPGALTLELLDARGLVLVAQPLYLAPRHSAAPTSDCRVERVTFP